ncbi:YolD-like family protein [Paenibacillus illinoisensis]|uniref:YolD-like family protein n=1 Tax=Paenibacillus illinoisensis TaxID=59845 RepID=UPI000FD8FDD9|nr:YolD-like family protein [Paenibacillus illinoisensis]
MASKLSGNGMYEGSRMILPEHREAYTALLEEQKKRGKPDLDEQAQLEIEWALVESYNRRKTVELVVFSPFEDERIKGIVVYINSGTKEIELLTSDGNPKRVNLAEITSASF